MALLSVNPVDLAHLIRERRECGGDRYDEVWDGVDTEQRHRGRLRAW